ncbi:N5-carboxyaminoimidazole ribonucleotide synthase [hydrothermal vent metagenome]|uniref:N5-carboxyaminoimidazole ribonucleotide synthase n=1 Tax=hydrothermal vent metagenome TaxID=652676 RepID=A0A3B0RHG4_9ZZZZ
MKPIGIFGGGQLAMMLARAATKLQLKTHVFAPNASCPAAQTADQLIIGEYEDLAAITRFAKTCSVISFEFENIPVRSLFHLQNNGQQVAPSPRVLQIIQDRLTEKQFLQSCQIALSPFARIDQSEDLRAALTLTGLPAVLKTRHFGYDGKGQTWIRQPAEAQKALEYIHHHPAVLERGVDFVREVSLIAARNANGAFVHFPLTENVHQDGILQTSNQPAGCNGKTAMQAVAITRKIAEQLEYVGVLAVEFFEQTNGSLLVNEIAPRVHNSGHWTIGAANPDQFELHIRAITGMELPVPVCQPAQMQNLIAEQINHAPQLRKQGWTITDYGKTNIRAGRKMGHAVRVN